MEIYVVFAALNNYDKNDSSMHHVNFFLKYVVCFRTNFRGTFNEYLDENSETVPDTFAGCVAVFCNPSTYFTESKSLCIYLC